MYGLLPWLDAIELRLTPAAHASSLPAKPYHQTTGCNGARFTQQACQAVRSAKENTWGSGGWCWLAVVVGHWWSCWLSCWWMVEWCLMMFDEGSIHFHSEVMVNDDYHGELVVISFGSVKWFWQSPNPLRRKVRLSSFAKFRDYFCLITMQSTRLWFFRFPFHFLIIQVMHTSSESMFIDISCSQPDWKYPQNICRS